MATFKDYWRALSPEDKRKFAASVGREPDYLAHIANGFKRAGPQLAPLIERATNGAVTRADLRPDIFGQEAA